MQKTLQILSLKDEGTDFKKSIKQSEKIAQSLNTCHMAYRPEFHPQNPHEKLASEARVGSSVMEKWKQVDAWILLASIA